MSHCHPVWSVLKSSESCAESSHPYLSKNVSSRLQSAHKGFTNSSCLGHSLVLCEYCGFGYISLKHKIGGLGLLPLKPQGNQTRTHSGCLRINLLCSLS